MQSRKERGRKRFRFYRQGKWQVQVAGRAALAKKALHRRFERDSKLSLSNHKLNKNEGLIGFEVLLRCVSVKSFGLVSSPLAYTIAEGKFGIIDEVGYWVLDNACQPINKDMARPGFTCIFWRH